MLYLVSSDEAANFTKFMGEQTRQGPGRLSSCKLLAHAQERLTGVFILLGGSRNIMYVFTYEDVVEAEIMHLPSNICSCHVWLAEGGCHY